MLFNKKGKKGKKDRLGGPFLNELLTNHRIYHFFILYKNHIIHVNMSTHTQFPEQTSDANVLYKAANNLQH